MTPEAPRPPPGHAQDALRPPQPQLVPVINTSWLVVTANCQSLHRGILKGFSVRAVRSTSLKEEQKDTRGQTKELIIG